MLPPKTSKRRARQPEGIIKDLCRDVAKRRDLLFWQVEGKSRKGVPDTLAGKHPAGSGVMLIEFKRPGREPEEHQWLRIAELRAAGVEAWWVDSVEGYRRAVGIDPGGYELRWPEWMTDVPL